MDLKRSALGEKNQHVQAVTASELNIKPSALSCQFRFLRTVHRGSNKKQVSFPLFCLFSEPGIISVYLHLMISLGRVLVWQALK